jgi:hypothetical protein
VQEIEGLGLVLGATNPRPVRLHPVAFGEPHPAIPSFRQISGLGTWSAPEPPLLDASRPLTENAWLLRRWYEGACEKYSGAAAWAFRAEKLGNDIARSKYYKLLVDAIPLFIEHGVRPASWCAYLCEFWKDPPTGVKTSRKGPPPVAFVFGRGTIEQRAIRGPYHEHASGYEGAKDRYTPIARALLSKQTFLRNDLRQIPISATDADIAKLVTEYFPGGPAEYERDLAQASDEAKQYVAAVRHRMLQGEWVW